MRRSLALVALLIACSSDKPAANLECDSDGDCAENSLASLCTRRFCRAGACAVENRANGTDVPTAFLQMPCTRLVCIDGKVTAVADPTNKTADTECTHYECDGDELITRDCCDAGADGAD